LAEDISPADKAAFAVRAGLSGGPALKKIAAILLKDEAVREEMVTQEADLAPYILELGFLEPEDSSGYHLEYLEDYMLLDISGPESAPEQSEPGAPEQGLSRAKYMDSLAL
jgi:hypothetical protein